MHDIGYYLIGALGVVGWVAVIWIIFGRKRLGRRDPSTDDAILHRLDDIDTRLAAVEKTLHEIP